ncbi:MAG: hypothetical protein K2H15_04770, partial [Muribaculaceae bacterium]|nr:hypothetical protein [Muribaculaceae bacterium]
MAAFIAGCSFLTASADEKVPANAAQSQKTISAVQLFPMNVASFENVNPELVRLTEEADKGFANGEIESIVIV